MNIAFLVALGYTLSVIVYALNVSETKYYKSAFYGTILLLIGYTMIAVSYTSDVIQNPKKSMKEQKITLDTWKRVGFGFITAFLIFNILGFVGITRRFYDVLGAFGYGLFTAGRTSGIYFVILYLLFSIIGRLSKTNRTRDYIQLVSKLLIMVFYILVLLPINW